ncbi:carbon storage regulator [Pseudomonas luteola]
MGLTLSRKEGERLQLSIDDQCDTVALLEALRAGDIYVVVERIGSATVKVRVDAPADLLVYRDELLDSV